MNLLDFKNRFCSAPPSYRNPKEDLTKRHNKIYFQFIHEYYQFLREQNIQEISNVYPFLDKMDEIDCMAKRIFGETLEVLDNDYPNIKKLFYGNHQELTVITKIVRYDQAEPDRWATTAHFDKSGLSLIWGSSDDNNESLLICEDTQNPSLEKLKIPSRNFARQNDASSAILIAGAALQKVGIDMKPTLHGVAPIKNPHRFAVISFLLIPDIDMSDIKTDFQ